MCLENFNIERNDFGIGYKIFKKTITPGKYRGLYFTFAGGYFFNQVYTETNNGTVPDGCHPYGFHIYTSLSDASRMKQGSDEVIFRVLYENIIGRGKENNANVMVAKSIKLIQEIQEI